MNDSGHNNSNARSNGSMLLDVDAIVRRAPVIDMHTHLFAPQFGAAYLSGIDELLTYHYLIAELFRSCPIDPEQFWAVWGFRLRACSPQRQHHCALVPFRLLSQSCGCVVGRGCPGRNPSDPDPDPFASASRMEVALAV